MSLISGNVIFTGSSINLNQNPNTILGLPTFVGNSINSGVISSGCFLDNSINLGQVIYCANFYGSSINCGVISGNAQFGNTAQNCCMVSGNAIFTGSSINQATVHGTASFASGATNNGTVDNYTPPNHPYQHSSYWSDDSTLVDGSILYTGRYVNTLATNVSFSQDGNSITTNGSGVVTVSTSKSWSVSSNSYNTLYTSNSVTDLNGATVYTDSELSNIYNGLFTYSSVKYASNGSGLANSYKEWDISYSSQSTIYTSVDVTDVTSASNAYSSPLLTNGFSDDFAVSGTSYTYSNGSYIPASYKIWGVTDDSNGGILYTSSITVDLNGAYIYRNKQLNSAYSLSSFTYDGTIYDTNVSSGASERLWKSWSVSGDVSTVYTTIATSDLDGATVYTDSALSSLVSGGSFSGGSFTYGGNIYDVTSGTAHIRIWKLWSVTDDMNDNSLYTCYTVSSLPTNIVYTSCSLNTVYSCSCFNYCSTSYCTDEYGTVGYL